MQVNIGKGIELEVPSFQSFTPEVQDYIVRIGLRNILMDSHAAMTPEKANGGDFIELSKAIAEKKLAAMLAGEVRSATVRESDPVKAEAMKLALAAVDAAIRKAGRVPSKVDAKVKREKAKSVMEKFMAQARKNVEAARAVAADLDIEI